MKSDRQAQPQTHPPVADRTWTNVILTEVPEPTVSYRTSWAVYEESLLGGRFVSRGWNGAGFVNFYDGRIEPKELSHHHAFWLELDGQLLASDWCWGGYHVTDTTTGRHAVITLTHAVRPVSVAVHTQLDGTAVLVRWLEITNTGDRCAALSASFPWSGGLQRTQRWRALLGNTGRSLYSLGYFENTEWGAEGNFQWHNLADGAFRFDGRYRRNRHRHPFFVLRNNATGEHFIGQIAWSGGYSCEFDYDSESAAALLSIRVGPDAPAPQRLIAPGETIHTPEVHLGLVIGDLDEAINEMHAHVRRSVIRPQARGRGAWVEAGIGPEIEITAEYVIHAIDSGAELGAEIFFIDASWYAPPQSNWWETVGDWQVDRKRFPQGLEPFRERVHAKGMLWGLWMDAERIGAKSRVATEHPEWLAADVTGQPNTGGLLDLANPRVAEWMEQQIIRVIEDNKLDFFRLDYNTHPGPGIRVERDQYIENGYWRYYDTLYAIYDRLRARFPDVVFENCAGGGGRTDLGLVRRFCHTWVTDWQIAPRSFVITNGMTMALPPEHVDRLLAGQSGHTTAEYDFQSRLLLFVRPSLGLLEPLGAERNPHLLARTRHWLALYKEVVRPFISTARIYHHTPCVPGPDPQGWGVLELTAEDRSRGICGLFQLSAPTQAEYVLRLRGLDVSRKYRVTFDNDGHTCEVDGFVLMKQGVTIRLEAALTSELLIYEAV